VVLCSFWANWAQERDLDLLHSRKWSCKYVGGIPGRESVKYIWTRLRHGISRRTLPFLKKSFLVRRWSLSRALPELERAAKNTPADLYIAHYPAALLAAKSAAEKHSGLLGYDAEDFYSEVSPIGESPSEPNKFVEELEKVLLPTCAYVTASSPRIADMYAKKYQIRRPEVVLNVFPLDQREDGLRQIDPSEPLRLYWFSQTIGANRGLEDIIRAMGKVKDTEIELHLRGVMENDYRTFLMDLSRSVNVAFKKIIFHDPGQPDEMIKLASQFDIGLALEQPISPNREICLTNKIFVYLLAGIAIIATETKAQLSLSKQISDAVVTYKAGDTDHLASLLKNWANNRDRLKCVREAAWDYGTRIYNWDIEKKKFLSMISDVLTLAKNIEQSILQ